MYMYKFLAFFFFLSFSFDGIVFFFFLDPPADNFPQRGVFRSTVSVKKKFKKRVNFLQITDKAKADLDSTLTLFFSSFFLVLLFCFFFFFL